jgi:hypothetical protein
MPVTWSHEAILRAPPDAVYAWMSDFREDDHARPAYLRGAGVAKPSKRPAVRRVVAREPGLVKLEDSWNGRTFRLTAHLDPERREVRIEGGMGYHAVWRAEPAPEGTRLRVDGKLAPGGVLGLFTPLFAKGMMREMAQDFRGHVADAEAELTARKG